MYAGDSYRGGRLSCRLASHQTWALLLFAAVLLLRCGGAVAATAQEMVSLAVSPGLAGAGRVQPCHRVKRRARSRWSRLPTGCAFRI